MVREGKEEDRLAYRLKERYQISKEYQGTIQGLVVCQKAYTELKQSLPELFPDLSNFIPSLMRWKKRISAQHDDKSTEIQDWLHEPNLEDDFDDFLKKWVTDLMVHGAFAIYKEYNPVTGFIDNFYSLPGGSVQPLRNRFVGGARMFAQIAPGEETRIYFGDEISFCSYMPNSAFAYGMIPLEALVNKVSESMFFDKSAADRADGTNTPEKMILFGDTNPFGELPQGGTDYTLSIDKTEQARLETVFNTPRKGAIGVLSGYGTPLVVDLSRADTFGTQAERQAFIRECVAFVFNLSNMEVNLTGSEDTSGRSTSDAQSDIDKEKGIAPIARQIATKINRDLLPYRFGSGYLFQFAGGTSDEQTIEQDTMKMNSRTYSVNEIRIARGDEPFQDPQYDLPDGGAPAPDGSQGAPLLVKQL